MVYKKASRIRLAFNILKTLLSQGLLDTSRTGRWNPDFAEWPAKYFSGWLKCRMSVHQRSLLQPNTAKRRAISDRQKKSRI